MQTNHSFNTQTWPLPAIPKTSHLPRPHESSTNNSRSPAQRGEASTLNIRRLSLPSTSPNRMAPETLLTLLSPQILDAVHTNAEHLFFTRMLHHISDANTDPRILSHTVSAIDGHYPLVLEAAHNARMLHWSDTCKESGTEKMIRHFSTVSSFAVVKDFQRDRLISWPKLQNAAGPVPPNPQLPNPAYWNYIRDDSSSLLGFHIDVSDMFHHLPLPPRLHNLFPMQPVAFGSLPKTLRKSVTTYLGYAPHNTDLIRPFQTTVPIGWSWAVILAQSVAATLLQQARRIYRGPTHTQITTA